MSMRTDDVFAILSKRIDMQGATPSQIQEAVNKYLSENPVDSVTEANILKALGYIPADQEDVNELNEKLVQLGNFVEPMEDDIPKVFIDGVIPTTKDDVLAELTYVSKTDKFHAYLEIKCQGTTSLSFLKKNFTIKMYSDETRETKLKKVFKDWKFEKNKYVLKANYIDHSHARNIVCARLWSEVVSSRNDYDALPTELKTSPNNGAVDGFPIKVYTNGTYQGIYTWNIGKDDWMWNMDENNQNHILMCAETNTDWIYNETPCNFRALWSGVNEQDWSVEVGTNSDSVKNSLNSLISCIKDTDDETFVATIENYLDLQSAIDYYIHQYVICGLDGLGKNILLGTYDLVKWRFGAYDMDATFGLWWSGEKFVSTNYVCPEQYQERYGLLWERIEKLYVNELKERYDVLRKTVYSFENIVNHFERFMDTIGKDLYAEDLEIYPSIPSAETNNIKQIRGYVRDRLFFCDNEFANMREADTENNVLSNVNWYNGYAEWNGEIFESDSDRYSDLIDISDYKGITLYTNLFGVKNCRIVKHRKDATVIESKILTEHPISLISSDVESIRFSLNLVDLKNAGSELYIYSVENNLFNSTNIKDGGYNAETGIYEPDSTDDCNIEISVTSGEKYLCNGLKSIFFVGGNGNVLSKITDERISFGNVIIPQGAVKLIAVATDKDVTNGVVCISTEYTVVGYAKVV